MQYALFVCLVLQALFAFCNALCLLSPLTESKWRCYPESDQIANCECQAGLYGNLTSIECRNDEWDTQSLNSDCFPCQNPPSPPVYSVELSRWAPEGRIAAITYGCKPGYHGLPVTTECNNRVATEIWNPPIIQNCVACGLPQYLPQHIEVAEVYTIKYGSDPPVPYLFTLACAAPYVGTAVNASCDPDSAVVQWLAMPECIQRQTTTPAPSAAITSDITTTAVISNMSYNSTHWNHEGDLIPGIIGGVFAGLTLLIGCCVMCCYMRLEMIRRSVIKSIERGERELAQKQAHNMPKQSKKETSIKREILSTVSRQSRTPAQRSARGSIVADTAVNIRLTSSTTTDTQLDDWAARRNSEADYAETSPMIERGAQHSSGANNHRNTAAASNHRNTAAMSSHRNTAAVKPAVSKQAAPTTSRFSVIRMFRTQRSNSIT